MRGTLSRHVLASIAALGALALAAPPASADAAAGREKAEQCQNCHGIEGVGKLPDVPNIGGQSADYLTKQLTNFRSGERQHEQMSIIAEGLSDEDIADVLRRHLPEQPQRLRRRVRVDAREAGNPERAARGRAGEPGVGRAAVGERAGAGHAEQRRAAEHEVDRAARRDVVDAVLVRRVVEALELAQRTVLVVEQHPGIGTRGAPEILHRVAREGAVGVREPDVEPV